MGFQAYQDIICLPLLWQMKDLIVRVADEKKNDQSWMRSLFGHEIQQTMEKTYQLRYPGEVLERYRDRCGDTLENMRALAIALAESRELLEADMFIGNQKEAFISSIRSTAETDIYLCGALYCLTDRKAEKESLKEKLLRYVPATTQEYVYLQSVFLLEQPEYETNPEKWNYFLGTGRTIKAFGNESVYAWFLNHFMGQVKSYHRKGAETVKSLMQLPIHSVYEGNIHWERLKEAGYSGQEILFLNMNLPFLSNNAERIDRNSITMERIVAHGCKEIMNAEKVESPLLFAEITKFLSMYQKFSIRLEGTECLTNYLQHRVKIRDVELFLYLYPRKEETTISGSWFLVNLLEDSWDKLADVLTEEQYIILFERCFCYHGKTQECLWLEKYEKLCGKSYFCQLWKHDGDDTWKVVKELVQTGNFKLVEILEQYVKEREHEDEQAVEEKWVVMLGHMRSVACSIYCHAVFHFWEVYEQIYGMEKLRQFLGERDRLSDIVKFERYSYVRQKDELWSGLEFLSIEEQRKLFYWECNELYRHDPDNYNKFLLQFLRKRCIGLFAKEECREIVETLLEELGKDSYEARQLREIYYTEEELNAYKEQECRQKEEQKRKAEQEQRKEWLEELTKELNNEGRELSHLGVIAKNAHYHYRGKGYYEVAYSCVMKELDCGNWRIEFDKLPVLLEFLAKIVSKKISRWKEICEIIQKLEVEEDELTDD